MSRNRKFIVGLVKWKKKVFFFEQNILLFQIDKIGYSSYPTDYSNKDEARNGIAKHALERLQSLKNQLKYEVCLDNEAELVIKIYDCIKNYPTGVFSKKIPGKFL